MYSLNIIRKVYVVIVLETTGSSEKLSIQNKEERWKSEGISSYILSWFPTKYDTMGTACGHYFNQYKAAFLYMKTVL